MVEAESAMRERRREQEKEETTTEQERDKNVSGNGPFLGTKETDFLSDFFARSGARHS